MSSTDLITFAEGLCCRIEKTFTYKWTIKSFRCENKRIGENLPYTKFEFNFGPDAKFSAQLRLNGFTCKDRQCSLYLKSTTLDDWFVLADLNIGNDNLLAKRIVNKNSNTLNWHLITEYDCAINKNLSNNAFTITCILTYVTYKLKKLLTLSTIDDSAELCENRVNSTNLITHGATHSYRIERKFTYKWSIENFIFAEVQCGESLPSTKFEFDFGPDAKFCGRLYLHITIGQTRQCILNLKSTTLDEWIVGVDFVFDDETAYDYYEALASVPKVICDMPLSAYNSPPCNRVLKISCIITYVSYEEEKSRSVSNIEDHDPAELFKTKLNSDVTFVVAEVEIPAHMSILADRSKVFATMFELEMDKSHKITINDIDLTAFKDMLCYIYTGEVIKVTLELLAASGKFDLPKLKAICENELQSKVTNETAAETLVIADLYNAAKLKDHTMIYIKENLLDVTKTEGWHELVNKRCSLFAEIWK